MSIDDKWYDLVSDYPLVQSKAEADGLLNRLIDLLEAHHPPVDPLQDAVEKLIADMILVSSDEVRGAMFESIERIRLHNHSVEVVLSPLIAMFECESSVFITNTLLLFPLASDPKEVLREVANSYSEDEDRYVRKNALYALQYLTQNKDHR